MMEKMTDFTTLDTESLEVQEKLTHCACCGLDFMEVLAGNVNAELEIVPDGGGELGFPFQIVTLGDGSVECYCDKCYEKLQC